MSFKFKTFLRALFFIREVVPYLVYRNLRENSRAFIFTIINVYKTYHFTVRTMQLFTIFWRLKFGIRAKVTVLQHYTYLL